jgi:hypothetical protein
MGFNTGSNCTDAAWVNEQTTLTGANVNVNVGNKTDLTGAVIAAGSYDEDGTFVDSGNLSLASGDFQYEDIKDVNTSKSTGYGLSVNFSLSKKWVNAQTTLAGANVNVGNKTNLTGAVIAAGSYDEEGTFVDSGNLSLASGDFQYEDIKDVNTSKSTGYGLSVNLSLSKKSENKNDGADANTTKTDADKSNKSSASITGSTTLTLKNIGSEKEQATKATVGNGAIIVDEQEESDQVLARLNRDVNNSQEITKDMITGALDGSVTVDIVDSAVIEEAFKTIFTALGKLKNKKNLTQEEQKVVDEITEKKEEIENTAKEAEKIINDPNSTDEEIRIAKEKNLTNVKEYREGLEKALSNISDNDVKTCVENIIKELKGVENSLQRYYENPKGERVTWCNLFLLGELAVKYNIIFKTTVMVINDIVKLVKNGFENDKIKVEEIPMEAGETFDSGTYQRKIADEASKNNQKVMILSTGDNAHGVLAIGGNSLESTSIYKDKIVVKINGLNNNSTKKSKSEGDKPKRVSEIKIEKGSFQFAK